MRGVDRTKRRCFVFYEGVIVPPSKLIVNIMFPPKVLFVLIRGWSLLRGDINHNNHNHNNDTYDNNHINE